jgi:peptidoglycan/LPS O-acetylase OafA/YrhL
MQDKKITAEPEISYMRQLDGLRAFAITFVIIAHWFSPFPSTGFIPYGEMGVILFFVLSGFLITTILLNYKTNIEKHKNSTVYYIGKFFKRRILRIFPIYYLTLFLIFIIQPSIIGRGLWWHCAYLSNFYFVLIKRDFDQPISQWWSLAVEEQFYLIWPFVIFFIRKKYLLLVILSIIVIGPVFRQLNFTHSPINNYLTPACFDSIACGALLALYYPWLTQRFTQSKFLMVLIFFLIMILISTHYILPLNDALKRVYLNCFSFIVIFKAAKGYKGIIGSILTNPLAVYIGKISYGLYIYHKLIPVFNLHIEPGWMLQIVRLIILLSIASMSYYLIEKPVLRLKKYV